MGMSASSSCERRRRGIVNLLLGERGSCCSEARFASTRQKTIERPQRYNELCEEIECLERSGAAYVFYPEQMKLTNRTTDLDQLQAAYDAGYAQAQRELDAWQKWLSWRP